MRRRSAALAATAMIAIVVVAAAFILNATLQAALTTQSAHNEQNPMYVAPHHSEQVNLNESTTANNLTLRVASVMNGADTDARRVWETYDTHKYAPLNPMPGSKYVILNVSVADANGSSVPFRYADSILVGNDGRAYYPNYAVGNANCTASITADQLKAGSTCDIYIAFSLPDNVAPAKIVYTASNPAIVVNLV